jgi:hypothetical protein
LDRPASNPVSVRRMVGASVKHCAQRALLPACPLDAAPPLTYPRRRQPRLACRGRASLPATAFVGAAFAARRLRRRRRARVGRSSNQPAGRAIRAPSARPLGQRTAAAPTTSLLSPYGDHAVSHADKRSLRPARTGEGLAAEPLAPVCLVKLEVIRTMAA